MSEDERKKLDATRLLFGVKDAPVAPRETHRQTVQLTPTGTTKMEPTREFREYLSKVDKWKADAELDRMAFSKIPRALPRAKSLEPKFKRPDGKTRDKIFDKDKDDEFER